VQGRLRDRNYLIFQLLVISSRHECPVGVLYVKFFPLCVVLEAHPRAIAWTDETFRVRFDARRCSSVAKGYGLRTFGGDHEADKPESRWRASLGLGVA
jgi:hypothetical protein